MRTIQYAIDQETGLIVSRVGSELAWPILNYDYMTEENNYQANYFLEKMPIYTAAGRAWSMLKWTKKIPTKIKNVHRTFWDMKLLKGMCIKCKKEIIAPALSGNYGTGYGTDKDNNKTCYACCAEVDKEQMRTTGRIVLYLATNLQTGCYNVTNWSNSLSFVVCHKTVGRHNIAGVRYDVWFWFEGKQWHGIQYGDNTQLCHCKRNKT